MDLIKGYDRGLHGPEPEVRPVPGPTCNFSNGPGLQMKDDFPTCRAGPAIECRFFQRVGGGGKWKVIFTTGKQKRNVFGPRRASAWKIGPCRLQLYVCAPCSTPSHAKKKSMFYFFFLLWSCKLVSRYILSKTEYCFLLVIFTKLHLHINSYTLWN